MSLDPDSFRAALGRFATGVTVVTCTDSDGADHGMTVSAFCSVSLHPPLVLVCVAHSASMYDAFINTSAFAINVLAAAQEPLARRFADLGDQRFLGIGFTRGECGAAILEDVLAVLECRCVAQHVIGDHTIVVGEVERATVRDEKPLVYYRGGFAQIER